MRITVTQLTNYGGILDDEWHDLVDHVRAKSSDLLLLPEMPFSRWLAADHTVVEQQWLDAAKTASDWLAVMPAFAPTAVVGTRAMAEPKHNVGYLVDGDATSDVHAKAYLPNEPGFWEGRWYDAAEPSFETFAVGDAKVGMTICTEMWSFEHVRSMGRSGMQVLVVPRATPGETLEKWLAGARAAAVTAGAYVASSNLFRSGGVDLGGMGFVIDPDGEILEVTSSADPFVTVEIDLAVADAAKTTYPRYVFG